MRYLRAAIVVGALVIAVPWSAGIASATPTTGSISGVVLDSNGNPLQGACIGAYSTTQDPQDPHGYTASGADGSFVLSDVPAGSYDVQIDGCYDSQHVGRDIQPEYYEAGTVSGTQQSDYTVLTVTGGSQLTLDSQRTRPGADIDIRIQDGAGNVEPSVYPVIIPVAPVPTALTMTGILKDMTSGGYWPITNLLGATYEIGYTYCNYPDSNCRVGYIGYYSGFGLEGVPGQTTPIMTTAGQTTTLVDTVTVPPLLSTTTTLSAAPVSVAVGSTITLTAHVTASSGTHQPTGQVYFSDPSDTSGIDLDPGVAVVGANGDATLTWTAEAGSHTITASYGGDGGLATSSGQVVIIDGQTQLPAGGSTSAATTTATVAAGGSVSSGQPGAAPDASDPLVVGVTTPTGGTVTIDTTPPDTSVSQYRVLNEGATITAPAASPTSPLKLSFAVFDGALPRGSYTSDLTVFRDGQPVGQCTGPAGTASPDPCLTSEVSANGSSTITVLSSHASTWDVEAADVGRIAGSDRIATAAAVSRDSFPSGGAGAVVLATANDYPDALVGAPLAAARNAPLLLTAGATVSGATLTEITRVLPVGATVYLLGGSSVVPATIASELAAAGYQVVRYGGSDRYQTSLDVAAALGNPSEVLLASGLNYPDALSAGPAAAHVNGAVLLTDGSSLTSSVSAYLAMDATKVYAVGGPASHADPGATAIAGADRYATAADVASAFFTAPITAGVATGSSFPDALSGGAQLARIGAPLLLASGSTVPSPTSAYLTTNRPSLVTLHLYGGTSVLPDAVEESLGSTLAP